MTSPSDRVADGQMTPWRVWCPQMRYHIYLTESEYLRQLGDPDALWRCPSCGRATTFDQDWFDDFHKGPDE